MPNKTQDRSVVDLSLFVLLAVFVFYLSLSRGPSLYFYPRLLFMAELLIILVHTFSGHPAPFRRLLRDPLVLYGALAWIAASSLRFALIADNSASLDNEQVYDYLLMVFHAVFFLYAIDIAASARTVFRQSRAFHNKRLPGADSILTVLLYGITFSIALTSGNSSFNNADTVLKHELVFIVVYLFSRQSTAACRKLFSEHRRIGVLLLFWLLFATIAFYSSPYDLIERLDAISRYHQVFFHVVFFLFVYQFLLETGKKHDNLFMMVPVSTAVLSVVLVMTWLDTGMDSELDWFFNPPFGDHIRHIGYIATASASIAMAVLLHPRQSARISLLSASLLLVATTLLFWTGGRAAAISVIGATCFMIAYFIYVRSMNSSRLAAALIILALSAVLSEVLKVCEWNGVINMIMRNEFSDMDALTTGRTVFWARAVESLKGHWLLGLGSQAYYFMPNRPYGIQPHSLFVQFVVEWGLLGAAIFLYLLARAGITLVKSLGNRNTISPVSFLAALAVILSLSIHGLVDGTYYHGQPSYYLALAFAVCLSGMGRGRTSVSV